MTAMHEDQEPYRLLYHAFYDYEGSDVYSDLVRPWLAERDGERRWFEAFARRTGSPIPAATVEDLWRLYALSRIEQLLQSGLSPGDSENDGLAGYIGFMESFGLRRIGPAAFHPFFHEIVTVDPAEDEDAAATVVQEYWPGYMLGPLLIARAGCRISAGAAVIDKQIAEKSTLYWAVQRHGRPASDLSHGWGSNSGWRTTFRRDYLLDGVCHYNVDARRDLRPPADDLDDSERLELLRFRSFIKCGKPHDDRWPYNDTHREPLD